MNPLRWLWNLLPAPPSPVPVPRPEVPPQMPPTLVVLTEEQKTQRRAERFTEMQHNKETYLGDCLQCWLPLTYPPIRLIDLNTLVWSAEPGQAEGKPELYCLECLPIGVEKYQNTLATGITIQGSPPELKVDNDQG